MAAQENRKYDLIVVGTGPGGASVAREASRAGARVLMLERGGGAPFDGSHLQALDMMGRPGANFMLTPQGLVVGRAFAVGGSSAINCASAFDPPLAMFEARGVDLKSQVEELRREVPIAPLEDSLVGAQARLLSSAAQDLGYGWKPFNKFIYQDKCRTGCFLCYTGCPHGAKWTARNLAEEAVRNGADLITRARVHRVVSKSGQAAGVTYSRLGRWNEVRAPKVVLAAGGLGTPVILEKTGITGSGENFFFDPLIIAFGTVDSLPGTGEVPMTAGVHLPEEGIMLTDLSVHPSVYAMFTAQMMRLDRLAAHKKTAGMMVKIRDELSGRLTARGGIRKSMGPVDWKSLALGYAHAKRILSHAGAHHVFKSWYIAGHPGGTAKIGEVVNADLETRMKNLYVCDCSVVPQAWGLPPSFTLAALGKRLGQHLTGKKD
ncbi:MAG: GMC family oxidoreductase N-terminal domain-containing protein [Thermodesulfobacteriota bacterium]